jgi:hypothetical protein
MAVLDLDFTRANQFPLDYDTDLESDWSNLSTRSPLSSFSHTLTLCRSDLFAQGDDFSAATIERGRNRYYQQQQASQVADLVTQTIAWITAALHVHLNVGQKSTSNTSSSSLSLETLSRDSLANKRIQPVANATIHLPPDLHKFTNTAIVSLRVRSFLLPTST